MRRRTRLTEKTCFPDLLKRLPFGATGTPSLESVAENTPNTQTSSSLGAADRQIRREWFSPSLFPIV
jgi:hypothetical protein